MIEIARPSQTTITRLSEGRLTVPPRKRRTRIREETTVEVSTVDPEVMEMARKLALSRPGTRVRVLSATSAIVENDRRAVLI